MLFVAAIGDQDELLAPRISGQFVWRTLGLTMSRDAAHGFLKNYERSLLRDLGSVESLAAKIRHRAATAKSDDSAPHLRRPEEVFLNEYAIPRLFQELQTHLGLSAEDARTALLSENHKHMKSMSSTTPARSVRHPFDKTFAPSARQVIEHWRSGKSNALRQACPDFALRSPCHFSIVFEGKYFEAGSRELAAAELVKNIYQAFFYRALPRVPGSYNRPAWDYEYACLLACDASSSGVLLEAWNSIPQAVQQGFWEGANVYVMVVRGEA